MNKERSRERYVGLFLICLMLILLSIAGCGRDTQHEVIDFSDTVQVARPDTSSQEGESLKVAVSAMVSPKASFSYYRELLDYLGRKLDTRVELIQRKTYGEVNELLGKGRIDIAFICSGPYAAAKEKYGFKLLVAPEIHGSHFYQSYLIVNKSSPYRNLEDLRGKTFAFTDPDSNTGRLVPVYWLSLSGEHPEDFFGNTVFTYSHDNSIMAVSRGLVDGAAVDGLIWEYVSRTDPELTASTRVIKRSKRYGIPPVVVSPSLSRETGERIRDVFVTAHEDSVGRRILDGLKIDRFIVPRDEWYDPVREMLTHVRSQSGRLDERAEPQG
ncbi:MAG: phosphate/phosphite/phosphonate ABC transporter substrate-binding protein [Desulfomonilaceae bacterium]|nr:phosphate/phosphite/phosphonate ABC transporter substrate-binding protein [Desulfomonilaceae bacterium]